MGRASIALVRRSRVKHRLLPFIFLTFSQVGAHVWTESVSATLGIATTSQRFTGRSVNAMNACILLDFTVLDMEGNRYARASFMTPKIRNKDLGSLSLGEI